MMIPSPHLALECYISEALGASLSSLQESCTTSVILQKKPNNFLNKCL